MLMPKKLKYRKQQKGRLGRVSTRGNNLAFGRFGLKALEGERITARQIEASRRAITRHLHRGGQLWIRIFPHKPVTTKPAEVPMGGGKGSLDHFVANVEPGKILFELDGVTEAIAREALRLASSKLPIKTKIVMEGE